MFSLLTFSGFSQTGKLELSFSDENHFERSIDSVYYSLHISNEDTIINKSLLVEWESGEIIIDSLNLGEYMLKINLPQIDSVLIYQRSFTILPNEITFLNISLDTYEDQRPMEDLTRSEIVWDRVEAQFELGYFDNKWVESNPKLTQSYSIAASLCYWSSFSKHVGFLVGSGVGINHSSISKDTLYFNTPQFNKRYEYYNYLYFSPEFKVRFTLKNQQHDYDFFVKGMILDIGARYNIPLMFKHVGRFTGNTKITESWLHQYTDLRVFANIGRAPALVFVEYRPFDFILGNYPELPKYTVGFKFVIHG